MNLAQMRSEVEAHGFDANQYGSRIVSYLNDAYLRVCRRVSYFVDESSQTVATTAGTATFSFPANLARVRYLIDTDRQVELTEVQLEDIDSSSTSQGTPNYYAIDQQNIHLYPTPDGVHNLLLRYWLLPSPMSADTDTPTIPTDYHVMLCEYAIGRCYKGDDDFATGNAWIADFEKSLAEFEADVRFPSEGVTWQARGMWDQNPELGGSNRWYSWLGG